MARGTRRQQDFTVVELVRRCSPPQGEERFALWLRRVRHWTALGILPLANLTRGRRNSRVYDLDALHIAALLLRISDFGIETNILESISSFIQNNMFGRGRFARFWRGAQQYEVSTQNILLITLPPETYPIPAISWYEGITDEVEVILDIGLEPAIALNVSRVFQELRAAEAEEG